MRIASEKRYHPVTYVCPGFALAIIGDPYIYARSARTGEAIACDAVSAMPRLGWKSQHGRRSG